MAIVTNDPTGQRAAVYKPPVIGRPAQPAGSQSPAAPAPPAPPTGSSIPGTGTYLAQQAQAQQAYENAKNDINYRRGQMYSQFGLLPSGQVDPNSKYGQYQGMLGQDANQLGQAKNSQQARGIGSAGLGGRVMQGLRDAQGAEHFGFQQTLANNLHGFDVEGLNAQQKLAGDMLSAQQGQEQWDFEHNQFMPAAPAAPAPTAPAASAPPKKVATAKSATKQQLLAQHLAAQKAKTARRP